MRHISLSIFFFLFASCLFAGTVVEQIVARVGNEIITKTDMEREEKRLYKQLSNRLQGDELQNTYNEQRRMLLEFMINQKLMEHKARELDLNVDEEVVAAIQRLREENNIPDDAALEAALAKEGTSLADLRQDFRRRIVQQRILWNYVQGKVNITEDEIKNYYEQHKAELSNPPVIRVSRYLISGEDVEKNLLATEAKSLINALQGGQDLKTENFPHLKIEQNQELALTDLQPEFQNIVNAAKVGEFTEPFEVSSGWIILKIEDRKEAEPVPFEEARSRIYNLLLQERAEKYQKSFLEDLRKQSFVEILTPVS